ncbi:MAG: hypothetical protein KDC05_09440 [Bacteroidales bacterium]|nr:hypothetical protein [Bacteroidales bacterium]
MFRNILHKFSKILMVFALLWIMAGSLIEFHQRYVFHKQVDLWQVVVTQTGKELKKSIRLIEKANTSGGVDLLAELNRSNSLPTQLQLSEKSIFSRYLFDLITPEYRSENLLRGPPMA